MSYFMQINLLVFVLLSLVYGDVFLRSRDAHGLLQRSKRANSGFFEEMKQGNLERECMEEVCDYEEAREVFEDKSTTDQFWTTYIGSNPCQPNPCLNDGRCVVTDKIYQCLCPDGFEGKYCQNGMEDVLKCLYLNGGCEHFCNSSDAQCECAEGYVLGQDGKKCIAKGPFPCGKIPLLEGQNVLVNQSGERRRVRQHCPKGHCPWQVLLQLSGQSSCSGVIVHPEWVVTAAHCVTSTAVEDLSVVAGEHDLSVEEGTEQRIPVTQAIVHERYSPESSDSNIALLRLQHPIVLSSFAVPVCLPQKDFAETELASVRFSAISGWGSQVTPIHARGGMPLFGPASPVLYVLAVPLLSPSQCALKSGLNLTANMLCAGYLEGSSLSGCWGDDGGPLVTWYGETAFLTGLVGLSRPCSYQGYFKIYTKVSNFLDWLQEHMNSNLTLTEQHPQPDPSLLPALQEQKNSGTFPSHLNYTIDLGF